MMQRYGQKSGRDPSIPAASQLTLCIQSMLTPSCSQAPRVQLGAAGMESTAQTVTKVGHHQRFEYGRAPGLKGFAGFKGMPPRVTVPSLDRYQPIGRRGDR